MSNITLRIIETIEELVEFEEQWEAFREQLDISNMCLSFTWIILWCRHYLRSQDRLIIHCYFKKDELIGIFPVYLEKISLGYQLRFVATGENKEAEICSEFQDFMLKTAYQNELLNLFGQRIKSISNIVACTFSNLLSESLAELWINRFFDHWQVKSKAVGVRYALTVESDQPAQLATLKSKTTKRQAKKYIANKDCTCEYLAENQPLDPLFSELVSLHNKSWHKRGQHGAFENNTFRKFHYQFATQAQKNKKLVMFKISYKDKTLAIFYGVIDGSTLYYYQSGILRESNLPTAGIAMHIEALAFAQVNSLEKYDLMKGKSTSYKQRIVQGGQPVLNLIAFKKQYSWLSYYWKLKSVFS
jgi:CelD/BcsL family acetyltransferase involved in cellulose biosynthesis